jgi:uncharacterized protein YndB with AHSA1/START domain
VSPDRANKEKTLMAPIVARVEIERSHEEVFSYVTDPARFAEWQAGVVGGEMEGGLSPSLGARCITKRRIGGTEREVTSEVTRLDPPSAWAVRGIDGPIRATVNVTVEPLQGSTRSRVTIELDFEGRGIGKLLVPLVVRRQARSEMPANCNRLKQRLEASTSRSRPGAADRG